MKPERVVAIWVAVLFACVLGLLGPLAPWPAGLRKEWSPSDYAAWAGAVGSVGAVWCAVWLYGRQRRDHEAAQRGLAGCFCINLVETGYRLSIGGRDGDPNYLRAAAAGFDEVIRQGQAIDIGALEMETGYLFGATLSGAVHLREILRAVPFDEKSDVELLNEMLSLWAAMLVSIGDVPQRLQNERIQEAFRRVMAQHADEITLARLVFAQDFARGAERAAAKKAAFMQMFGAGIA